MAVLNLAQAVELAVEATLVENNVPIYDKGNRTIVVHDALTALGEAMNANVSRFTRASSCW